MIRMRMFILVCFMLASYPAQAVSASGDDDTDGYAALVELFREWREFEKPKLVDGVPDYTADAMAEQYQQLEQWRARLAEIDTSGWPIPHQVDYHLVRAEMNGLDFDHRVRRPWARNPAFYTSMWASQSDVPAREGPVAYGALELWTYDFPLTPERRSDLRSQLQVIPPLLQQAKGNLIEDARDLWMGGIRRLKVQKKGLADLAENLKGKDAELEGDVEQALQATVDFIAWLEKEAPSKTGPSGVGKENYTWYLQNVHLLPYTWEEEVTIARRELARSHTSLRLEEHRNRNLPPATKVSSREEFEKRMNASVTKFLSFLENEEILSMRDYMEPALRAQVGTYEPVDGLREFFWEAIYHAPIVIRPHHYHWIELARMENEPHESEIRRVPLLYNIFDGRAEGLATGMEEMMMHAGLMDDAPRDREVIWIMLAQRAARALAGLHMHSNDWTMQEAVEYAAEWTPRGWMAADSRTVWFEQDLYLKQPGYGTSYVIGKVEIEHLMRERAHQLGDAFSLKRFMDEINDAGVIPVSLVRWEMTGNKDPILSPDGD